jgi:hypothetical protein
VTNQVRLSWIGEIRRLTVENNLTENPVEEGVLHVKLLNQPFAGGSNSKHRADGDLIHKRDESIVVVNPGALRETSEDPMNLIPIECSVGEELIRENPLAGDDVVATGPGNNFPCPIAHQGPILLHSRTSLTQDVLSKTTDDDPSCHPTDQCSTRSCPLQHSKVPC